MGNTVLVAGATGYLGRQLVALYAARGWEVRALVRDASRARALGLGASTLVKAEATRPETLAGCMDGPHGPVDCVISALGITRQRDGLAYRDVDFQANANLLTEAQRAGVPHFGYVHVLNAERMPHTALVRAKQDFVDLLQAAPIKHTIIAPSGYFSDMGDFMQMASMGFVLLFGNGQLRVNPIHGADVAACCVDAMERGEAYVEVGGPETFTHDQVAELAFLALDKKVRIVHLPHWLGDGVLRLRKLFSKEQQYGTLEFTLAVTRQDMVAPAFGTQQLEDFFGELAREKYGTYSCTWVP